MDREAMKMFRDKMNMMIKRLLWISMLIIIIGVSVRIVNASLTDGLFAYYTFDGNINDSTNTYNLRNINATYGTGKIGNSALFDSAGDRIYIDGVSSFPFNSTTSGMTMCAWINSTSTTSYQRALLFKINNTNNGVGLQYRADPTKKLKAWKSTDIVDTGLNQGDTTFNYVCVIDNSTGIYTYANAVYVATANADKLKSFAYNSLTFGIDINNPSEYFSGMIDEVGIWNRTLSSSEITLLMSHNNNGTSYPFVPLTYTYDGSIILPTAINISNLSADDIMEIIINLTVNNISITNNTNFTIILYNENNTYTLTIPYTTINYSSNIAQRLADLPIMSEDMSGCYNPDMPDTVMIYTGHNTDAIGWATTGDWYWYNITSDIWTNKTATHFPNSPSGVGTAHFDNVKKLCYLFIRFGGGNANAMSPHAEWTYNFTSNSWTNVSDYTSTLYLGKDSKETCYNNDTRMTYFYSGDDTGNNPQTKELWAYNHSNNKYINLTALETNSPQARFHTGFSYDSKNKLCLLFGGLNASTMLSDSYALNMSNSSNMEWTNLSWNYVNGTMLPRSMFMTGYDRYRNLTYIISGRGTGNNNATNYKDIWECNYATLTCTFILNYTVNGNIELTNSPPFIDSQRALFWTGGWISGGGVTYQYRNETYMYPIINITSIQYLEVLNYLGLWYINVTIPSVIDEGLYTLNVTADNFGNNYIFNLTTLDSVNIFESCTPLWTCNNYGICSNDSLQYCDSVIDLNVCNETYSGNYSEFSPQSCNVITGSGFRDVDTTSIINVLIGLFVIIIIISIFLYMLNRDNDNKMSDTYKYIAYIVIAVIIILAIMYLIALRG
jgi:hypothetical protein